jgi:hypothetical protein
MRLAIVAEMVNKRNNESAKEKGGDFYLKYLRNKENNEKAIDTKDRELKVEYLWSKDVKSLYMIVLYT